MLFVAKSSVPERMKSAVVAVLGSAPATVGRSVGPLTGSSVFVVIVVPLSVMLPESVLAALPSVTMPGVVLLPNEVEMAFRLPAPVMAPAIVSVEPAYAVPVGLLLLLLPPVITSMVSVLVPAMEMPRVALPRVVVWSSTMSWIVPSCVTVKTLSKVRPPDFESRMTLPPLSWTPAVPIGLFVPPTSTTVPACTSTSEVEPKAFDEVVCSKVSRPLPCFATVTAKPPSVTVPSKLRLAVLLIVTVPAIPLPKLLAPARRSVLPARPVTFKVVPAFCVNPPSCAWVKRVPFKLIVESAVTLTASPVPEPMTTALFDPRPISAAVVFDSAVKSTDWGIAVSVAPTSSPAAPEYDKISAAPPPPCVYSTKMSCRPAERLTAALPKSVVPLPPSLFSTSAPSMKTRLPSSVEL